MADPRVSEAIAWLESRANPRTREEMLTRYGITAPKAFGIPMATMQQLAKRLGRDHDLAQALWHTGWFEARMVACMVDVPELVTVTQMNAWAKDFDNWGICDTVCFKLFDQVPKAWDRIEPWSKRKDEFVRRGAFALLASIALHNKRAPDAQFVQSLALIERHATDERNFVKKGVSWALRSIGRRNPSLKRAAVVTAKRLAASEDSTSRWIGRDALKDLMK